MRIVLLGPPGAGKGTQSVRLARHLHVPHLSSGEMLRAAKESGGPLAAQIQHYLRAGELVPDSLVLDIIPRRLSAPDCAAGYLLDGFPRNRQQAEALDDLLERGGTPLDLVLELSVDEHRLIDRLTGRQREDDVPDVVAQRLRVYRTQTNPLVAYYRQRGVLKTIDGNVSPDEVSVAIRQAVEEPSPPAC